MAAVVRRKCGEILIWSNDNFSLICDFCGGDFVAFEYFRHHIKEHFPKTQTNIKTEDAVSYGSDCDSNNLSENDVKENFADIADELLPVPERSDALKLLKKVIKTETYQKMEVQQNGTSELLSNSVNENKNSKSLLIDEHDPLKQENIVIEQNSFSFSTKRLGNQNSKSLKAKKQTVTNGEEDSRRRKTNVISSSYASDEALNFKCSFCCKIFSRKYNLTMHEVIHTGKRPHTCQICSQTFTHYTSLVNHTKAIHKKNRQRCSACEKSFINKSELNVHTRECHLPDTDPRRYFPCKLCDDKFKTHNRLNHHKARAHKKHSAKFTCDYCQKEFTCRQYIVNHLHIHAGTKLFGCRYCNKKFAQASARYTHAQTCVHRSNYNVYINDLTKEY